MVGAYDGGMSESLVLFRGDAVVRATRLAEAAEDERRRFAVRAARDRDVDALWELTEAFVLTTSAQGWRTSKHTLRAYRQGVVAFVGWAQGVNLLRPGVNDGVLYVRWLERQTSRSPRPQDAEAGVLRPATVRQRLAAARALYGALRWAGATDARPFEAVRPARDDRPEHQKRRPYSDGEVERLLARADEEQTVIVLLGAHAGLRVSEMLALRWEGVDLEAGRLTVRGKGGWVQSVSLSPRLELALVAWRAVAPASGWVVRGRSTWYVAERVKVLCAAAGVRWQGRHVHGFRHSAGTKMLAASRGNLRAVQVHLRHRDISSTTRYTHLAEEGLGAFMQDW